MRGCNLVHSLHHFNSTSEAKICFAQMCAMTSALLSVSISTLELSISKTVCNLRFCFLCLSLSLSLFFHSFQITCISTAGKKPSFLLFPFFFIVICFVFNLCFQDVALMFFTLILPAFEYRVYIYFGDTICRFEANVKTIRKIMALIYCYR